MASKRRRAVIRDLERFVERSMRRLQLRCYQALTSVSPVDTGFFRAGWSPSIGEPDRSGPSARPVARESATAQATALLSTHGQVSQGIASTYVLSSGPVFIVNNVRYGVFLNQGSSAQAPAMFVEQAIVVAVNAAAGDLK